MKIPERPIRKFNPGTFQSDEEVIEQFVVRKREYDVILEVLRGNIDSPSCQHILITAPRGRGKTMLLARIAAEIRTKNEFSKHLMAVRFMEENQEISNMADFWLETLFHLAQESAGQDPTLAVQLRSTYEDLSRHWREQTLEERARAAVLKTADQLDKKLVLMVENLQSLESLDKDFGWKLRAILQSESQVILLTSATNRFKGLDDASQPFFELFRIIDLEPLTTKECGDLWQVISGDSVCGREIRPLQILTGGNPRLLVIIAGFTQHRSVRQLMEELVTLVDEHTEYFRGHLDILAKTERRVYVAVLDLWQPSKPGEIADRARMDVRTVSTMLGRLINRGAVIMEGSGKKRLYSAVERLYTIYYKLRRERDEAAVVQNLIRFIVTFYSERVLENIGNFDAAIAAYDEVVTRSGADNTQNIQQSVAIALFERGNAQSKLGDLEAAISAYAAVAERFGASDVPGIQRWVAVALVCEGDALAKLGDYKAAIATCDELVGRFGTNGAPDIQRWVALALSNKSKHQIQTKSADKALETCEELEQRLGIFLIGEVENEFRWRVRYLRTEALQLQGETQAALEAFRLAYAAFMPDNEIIMQEMISTVPDLIASGLSEYDLVKILSSDSTKSATLEPLVIALRQNAGESVRAPAEMLEVAEDIRNQINEKRLQKSAQEEQANRK